MPQTQVQTRAPQAWRCPEHSGFGWSRVMAAPPPYTALTVVWFWFALGILLLVVEVYTSAFYALFIAIGSFAAAVTGGLGLGLLAQVVVGAVVALAGALVARPVIVRAIQRRVHPLPPVLSGLVGQSGLTAEAVGDEHHPGHVVLNGERWLATTSDSDGLEADVAVTVMAVNGTTLVVRRR